MIQAQLKRLSLYLPWKRGIYPAPVPLLHKRSFWIATCLVAVAVVAFCVYFILYLTGLQDAYLTHAEDLGIIDQAIWNMVHGNGLHQTICNIIGDTNCVGPNGISRFAIHFEPILFLVSLSYTIAATPKTLIVLQTLIVASGAFPAFWLARLRLRNDWVGIIFAALYLCFPFQQQATTFDFHAVTFTIAFVMFLLYFMYTRQTLWLLAFALLSLACKEEIAGIIVLCGLWTMLLQGRWRSGLALIAMAFAWTGLGLYIVHLSSPTGHSLLAARYSYLGSTPIQIAQTLLLHSRTLIKEHVLEPTHFFYLRLLLSPTAYLALLAPWVLILAVPTIALNLLSTDNHMYVGLFQYNAEIVPILIFATIEAVVVLLWLLRIALTGMKSAVRWIGPGTLPAAIRRLPTKSVATFIQIVLLFVLVMGVLLATLRSDVQLGSMPFSANFQWPQSSAHVALAQTFLQKIPPQASVSAQSQLVPHLSHRTHIYLFPYADTSADYVFLDVTSTMYPFYSSVDYIREAKKLILSGGYGIVDARDGYLLLKKGLTSPGVSAASMLPFDAKADTRLVLPNLPKPFCSYLMPPSHQAIPHPVKVTFQDADDKKPTIELTGFHVNAPTRISISSGFMSITTYWQVLAPSSDPFQLAILIKDKSGHEDVVSTDVPSLLWCQSQTWKPGMIVRLTTQVFNLRNTTLRTGPSSVSLALIPLMEPDNHIGDVQARRPLSVIQAPHTVVYDQTTKTLQLTPITLIP